MLRRIFIISAIITTLAATAAAQSPTIAATDAPFDPSVARSIEATELKKLLDEGKPVVIVDGRDDLAGEIVTKAVQVTEEQLVAWSETASKENPIVFYCTCDDDGIAIGDVLGLQNLGFKNAYYLKGGLEAARAAGIPIVKPAK